VDAAAWAHANGVGVTAIARRLEAPVQTVSKRLQAAGVHVGPSTAFSEKTERMLAELRDLQSDAPLPCMDLSSWVNGSPRYDVSASEAT
jgi:hypothetical protein